MFWLIIFFSSQCEIPKFSLVQNSNFNLFKIKLVFGVIFYDSQEIINFYVSLSVLAHCGFNQDVVTKCLTSESRHEARVRGSHPAQLSHLHMKLFQLALWELCLTKFLFNGVGTEKKSLPLCYRGQSASFRLSLHSICWDNDPPSPQSFFHLPCSPPHEHCMQTWCTGEPWVTLRSRLEDRATVCELWWRICWPATIQTMTYSLIFRGHGLRTSRGQSTLLTFIKSAVQYAMFRFPPHPTPQYL